jgi:hypothetical protein
VDERKLLDRLGEVVVDLHLTSALILVAVACYALATNIAVPLQQRYGSLAVIARPLAVASVLLAIPGAVALAGAGLVIAGAVLAGRSRR